MNFTEYQELASRTCVELGEKLNLSHMVLGIATELWEMENHEDSINYFEEAGDASWFLINLARMTQCPVDDTIYQKFTAESIVMLDPFERCFILQDAVKGYIAYNKPMDMVTLHYNIQALLMYLHYCCTEDEGGEEYLERNIAKLQKRYPEKYTDEAAINRNLEAEREALEG
jgi:hypothetical protein